MSFFEQTAETEMFWDAVEEEEVLDTVLPVKADKEDVVVELKLKTILFYVICEPSVSFLKGCSYCTGSTAWVPSQNGVAFTP